MTRFDVWRQRIQYFALGVVCTLVAVAGLQALRRFLALPGTVESNPYRNAHYFRALAAADQHNTDLAIREWQALESDGWGEVSTEPLVELLMGLRRYEEALVAVDRNKSHMGKVNYVFLRARLLERWRGTSAAVEWLDELAAEDPSSHREIYWMGTFHLESGRPREALEPLLESVRRVCVKHGYRFDQRDSLVDVAPPPARDADFEIRKTYSDNLGDFCSALEYLALAYEKLGDDAQALRWATRDISLQQHRNALTGYMSAREVECGSVTGRIVRAGVFMRRGQLDEAQVDVDFASSCMTKFQAPETQQRLDDAIKLLSELRAEETKQDG